MTSFYHAGDWNIEQAVEHRTSVTVVPYIYTANAAAALAGSIYQTTDGASKRARNRLIRIDLTHPPVLRDVHATMWEKLQLNLRETMTPVQ